MKTLESTKNDMSRKDFVRSVAGGAAPTCNLALGNKGYAEGIEEHKRQVGDIKSFT